MTQTQICPHCRSVFEINGVLDFAAKATQVINCPVCGQEIWIPSGLWPQKWTVGRIIKENYEPSPPVLVTQEPESGTVWQDFSILGPLKDLGSGLYKIGIWVIVALVLVLLITRKWDK